MWSIQVHRFYIVNNIQVQLQFEILSLRLFIVGRDIIILLRILKYDIESHNTSVAHENSIYFSNILISGVVKIFPICMFFQVYNDNNHAIIFIEVTVNLLVKQSVC